MLADETVTDLAGGVVQRVVGDAHVGELGVAALLGDDAAGEQRVFRRNGPERAVGMPEPVAEVEHAPPVVALERLAVLVQVRDVDHALLQAEFVRLGDVAALRILDGAEV